MRHKASAKLSISISIFVLMAGLGSLLTLNWQMKDYAQKEAKEKARILLDRNLATHTYFSHQLKPKLFKKMKSFVEKSYFEPTWMSSTYAVREIDKYYHEIEKLEYYYKEAAINARSPENEADAFEREFIEALNNSSDLVEQSAIRSIKEKPFLVVLRRGETLEQNCLRCHSTPELAPSDMIAYYGPDRSFNRSEGETVSAISIRIPLSAAYADINRLILKLSCLFAVTLLLVAGLSIYLSNRWVFLPLNNIRIKAMGISKNPKYLGEQITLPSGSELADLTEAFNLVSVKLRQERDQLESRVIKRTEELNKLNVQLETEVTEHKETIAKLEKSLAEIKTLRGILPICSYCKQIRDDQGYWNQIEAYIADHSDVDFSHSICPKCAKNHYPDLDI